MKLPEHIAIVMDGNGRWAAARKKSRTYGHRAGVGAVKQAIAYCLRAGIPCLTLFAFSSENWARPKAEVDALLRLFMAALDREREQLRENGVRLSFIGDLARLSRKMQDKAASVAAATAPNDKLRLNIAINYGGRWDVLDACRRLAAAVEEGSIGIDQITPEAMASALALGDVPEPDLFIRTGGEKRLSNFLLWQIAYCELHFTDTLWPDFDERAMQLAVDEFARRERRFGKTGQQLVEERHEAD